MSTKASKSLKGGGFTELFNYAFTGVNIIPTILLMLVVVYWILAIIGTFDLDFFDIDIDGLDLEGGDPLDPMHSLAMFLRIGQVPFGLVVSIWVLDFWVIAMLMYYLPIKEGGIINGLLLVPSLIVSLILTKYQIIPLKGFFNSEKIHTDGIDVAMENRCTLLSDLEPGRLGQAAVYREGADIIINVKTDFAKDHFVKGEKALIMRKDPEKNIYYVSKTILNNINIHEGGDK